MCRKIRCDGKSKKFYKTFWELNKALTEQQVDIPLCYYALVNMAMRCNVRKTSNGC